MRSHSIRHRISCVPAIVVDSNLLSAPCGQSRCNRDRTVIASPLSADPALALGALMAAFHREPTPAVPRLRFVASSALTLTNPWPISPKHTFPA